MNSESNSNIQYICFSPTNNCEFLDALLLILQNRKLVTVYVTGPAKTRHICTKYTYSENCTHLDLGVHTVKTFCKLHLLYN